ncbi:MAG: fructose-6-phosphate aldolase [Gemmatimonadota bacterium]|nr:fructose-6-phosphate aldolase [Gemmatimonadota bacterium]MDE2865930.1 fructose-6-phosphate aldolase [Gemmatimonadota bacterium]MXX54646.1 fructose-6-phosphate aldolase [Gemmatimonadota bacterium]MXX72277.1 fructose-6-phosphate aldolase [Gemmatimonadota bacterium]MYB06045.1 fructose-6-phosphate aldolase [Gemmatimonadota bacterium]
MKIYLDTANLGEIREAARWGILSGVTTNPSLMAQEEGADFEDTIRTICELVNGPISAETVSEDADGMVREGVEFAGWHSNVIIKVPSTTEGLEAVSRLGRRGIRCNVTLIFNTNQALLAALAGAFVVSPFIGRVDDMSYDGMELIREIAEVFDQDPDIRTQILAASIRHPRHVTESALAGAHIATCPFNVLRKCMQHPLTDRGMASFLADWRKREAAMALATAGS